MQRAPQHQVRKVPGEAGPRLPWVMNVDMSVSDSNVMPGAMHPGETRVLRPAAGLLRAVPGRRAED
jgi:hypothetical protein